MPDIELNLNLDAQTRISKRIQLWLTSVHTQIVQSGIYLARALLQFERMQQSTLSNSVQVN